MARRHSGWTARLATAGVAGLTLVALLVIANADPARASHGPFTVSAGIYRIPFANGTSVTANNDHHTHPNAFDRVDLGAANFSTVVAAASGIIRGLVDTNGDDPEEHSCTDDTTVVGDCSDYNNYVWIEHPNGEWTKYTHMETGSVAANGWAVGETILVGQPIGLMSDVGAATGPHLHFEVAVPSDPNDITPFSELGGFIQGSNVVTFVCDIQSIGDGDNLYTQGEAYTANPCTNTAPTADAGGPYSVDEGSAVQLDGTASSDPENAILSYDWDPAANLDDPTIATPTYTGVDDTVDDLTLTVSDIGGDVTAATALTDTDMTSVTVTNVPPTVTASGDAIDEAGTATVSATFSDPGTLDTHTATIDWDDGGAPEAVTVAQLAAGVDHTYGDNGTFEVNVTVTDDDGGAGSDVALVGVANLDPTLTLDTSGAISFPGGDYLVVEAGGELPSSADGTDPGSDDLTFTWSTGDVNTYFNNLIGPDPFPSPFGTFPFAASDSIAAVYASPGVELLALTLSDDDGGEDAADAGVIVTGNADTTEGSGWWKHQYAGDGSAQIDAATAAGYLEIVNAVSSVFSEAVVAATAADVHGILSPTGSDWRPRARAELMVAWLQFASGAVATDATVPLGGGAATPFLDLMADAEATVLNPAATNAALQAVAKDLERVRQAA
jgi:murein DD-endopeptidase MepM/ murein hydrolase activator NlpD